MTKLNWAACTDAGPLEGYVAPGFQLVADAFERNICVNGELGASASLTIEGEFVVDIWSGYADPGHRQPWTRNTRSLVWSCTKGATALCAHVLASRGELDLDALVSAYCPESGGCCLFVSRIQLQPFRPVDKKLAF